MFSDIVKIRENALAAAHKFIGDSQPLKTLGWGISGYVLITPDLRTAQKVLHYELELNFGKGHSPKHILQLRHPGRRCLSLRPIKTG